MLAALATVTSEVTAQRGGNRPIPVSRTEAATEPERIRSAAALEAAGDFRGAERMLLAVLERNPTSLGALIALERVLAVQGRPEDLMRPVDRLLKVEPSSVIAHQMRVRTYSGLADEAALERVAEAWIEATPVLETPYREIARAWRTLHQPTRAVEVLTRGRERIDRPDALALELGDAYVDAGADVAAIREWDRAIGDDGHGFLLIQRRLAALPNGGAGVIPGLVEALTDEPTTLPRQKAAAQLAIAAGLEADAYRIAETAAASLEGQERQSFLVEMARGADGAGLVRLAYWSYGELLRAVDPVEQKLAIRTRLAELALEAGDTVRASAEYRVLEDAAAIGSPQRRQALAVRIGLLARDGEAGAALAEIERFKTEFADAPELDETAAAVANALIDEGEIDAAATALAGTVGPHVGLARARLQIHNGDVAAARRELLRSAPALRGAEATEAIALATLLGRLSRPAGERVARALTLVTAGEAESAVDLLSGSEESGAEAEERAALLDLAARLAQRAGLTDRAEAARREIVSEHADAREAPAALLGLARDLIRRGAPVEEAQALLERLILEHPRSALVPQARRALDELRGRVPPSGSRIGGGG